MGLTDRGRAAAAGGVTLAAAGLALGFEELTRVGLFGVALVTSAALLVLLSPPHVDVETSQHDRRLHVGDAAPFPLHIRPRRRRSPVLRLDQPLPTTLGGGSARAVVPALTAPQRFNLDLTVTFQQRGRHDIPEGTLVREDPFGLAARRWAGGTRRSVIVYPRIHALTGGLALGGARRDDGEGLHHSVLPGDEYGSIRAYRPGDDLRRVHWPATAHRGELMTRHDERASSPDALLVLDAHAANQDVLEWEVELVASVVAALDADGRSYDLLTERATVVGRDRPHDRRDLALTTLALVPTSVRPARLAGAGPDPLAARMHDHANRAGVVILVAGTNDPAGVRDLLPTLPIGVRGLAFLVGPDGGTPGDLEHLAARAGWTPQWCTPSTDPAAAWQDAIAGAAR